MADAEVGDDVYGEDPTVNRLQSLAASLLGKEAALYVPSGTMANQLAIRVLAGRGHRGAVRRPCARVPLRSRGRAPVNSGVQMHPLWRPARRCATSPIEGVAHHLPQARRCSSSRTRTWRMSGAPTDAAEMAALCDIAHAGGLAVHVDGARIWNAAIALGASPRRARCAAADTVMFCLSKGLGAPVGSLLCGPRDVIAEARETVTAWAAAMRQAGVIAAAGVVALETMVERLADDHVRARRAGRRARDSGGPAASIPRRCARTSCAPTRAGCPTTSSRGSDAVGCPVGHDRPAHVPPRHAQGRRRRRAAPCRRRVRRDRRHARRRGRLTMVTSDEIPERVLAIYAHPTIPRSRPAARSALGRRRRRSPRRRHDARRQGHERSRRRPGRARAAARRGDCGRGPRARHRRAPSSRPSRRRARRRPRAAPASSCGSSGRCAPTSCAARTRPPCSSATRT